MTNLDIIKYLATNNPTRLAELLDDIYCDAYNDGYIDDWGANPNFKKWLFEEASVVDTLYSDGELEEWSKAINNPSIEITYPDNLIVQIPYEGKDPNHMWNTDNNFNIISKAIDEIQPLETLVNIDKYSVNLYNSFRKEVCAGCNDPNCLRSLVEIYDCDKFEKYYEI